MIDVATWMNLENFTLDESQSQKKPHIFYNQMCIIGKSTEIESRLVVAQVWGEMGMTA